MSWASTQLIVLAIAVTTALTGCAGFKEWQYLPKTKAEERTIQVVTHGLHTGIVVSRQDLGEEFAFLGRYLPETRYYELGWGEAGYYQAEKNTVWLALKALFWRNDAVMHVVAVPAEPEEYFPKSQVVRLNISAAGLERLKKALHKSFKLDDKQQPFPLKKGLYGESRFFKAEGHYFIANTCNSWTMNMLEEAGLPTDALTLLPGSVISQAQTARQKYHCCEH